MINSSNTSNNGNKSIHGIAKRSAFKFLLFFSLIFFLIIQLNPTYAVNTDSTHHFNACLHADNVKRINANGECLAMQSYFYKNKFPPKNSKLLIFIHGDGANGGGPSDYLKYQATLLLDPTTLATVLIRPGYYDSHENYSTGESHAFDYKGFPHDGYRKKTIATLAAAIKELKDFYQPRCTILVGHSGGAMMSGVILGKYSHLVNGAVLASTTNNVHEWTSRHGWGTWPHSLSPHDWVAKIPKDTFIYIVSGNKDKNTYPEMAKAYYKSLKKLKVPAYFINVQGGAHNSIVLNEATEFKHAIQTALKDCPLS
jgi:predicted esterase